MQISKSMIKEFLQCKKMFSLSIDKVNNPIHLNNTQNKFDLGNEIGLKARAVYQDGYLIKSKKNNLKIDETLKNLDKNILFEATFDAIFDEHSLICQIDILRKNDDNTWDVIEVKAGTSVKPEYIEDIAIQKIIISQNTNIKVKNFFIWHINKDRKKNEELFVEVNVNDLIDINELKIKNKMQSVLEYLKDGQNYSQVAIGSHCSSPYDCRFKESCWQNIKNQKTIFQLPHNNNMWDLYKNGKYLINQENFDDISKVYNPEIIKAVLYNRPYINKENIVNFIDRLVFPLSILDFETINWIEAYYPSVGPYEQIPFQFSLNVMDRDFNSKIYNYLSKSYDDPREEFCVELIKALPEKGSIIVYNIGFESSVLDRLALAIPKYKKELESIKNRLVDLYPIVRNNVYFSDFNNSYSLKSITPAILGKNFSYNNLDIHNGVDAQNNYKKMLKETDVISRVKLISQLISYCEHDVKTVGDIFIFLYNKAIFGH